MGTPYDVETSESAELDIERIFLWLNQRSPKAAMRWYEGLRSEIEGLSLFPYRNPLLPGSTDARRQLFQKYWIVYMVVESDTADEAGIVRILHVHHGARP